MTGVAKKTKKTGVARRGFSNLSKMHEFLKNNSPPSYNEREASDATLAEEADPGRRVVAINIALDVGTAYTKCVYEVRRKSSPSEPPRILHNTLLNSTNTNIHTVYWQNGSILCPTQLAYVPDRTSGLFHPVWGSDVSYAIREGEITGEDVLEYLKLALYADTTSGIIFRDRLMTKITRLNAKRAVNGVLSEDLSLDDIWTNFLGLVYRFVCERIKSDLGPDIDWPVSGPDNGYYKNVRLEEIASCSINVVLPVPAGSTVQHCEHVLKAAKIAGIPNCCYLVAEPSAAAAYITQVDFETNGKQPDTRPLLLLDLGGGTADGILCSVTNQLCTKQPEDSTQTQDRFMMKEHVEGQMRWAGAGFVNEEFRSMLETHIDVHKIANHISEKTNKKITATQFLNSAERKFETAKRSFLGDNKVSVDFQYVPFPDCGDEVIRVRGSRIEISCKGMIQIFKPCIDHLFSLIDQIIDKHSRQNKGSNHNSATEVKRIVMVGGGSESTYVQRRLIERYQDMKADEESVHSVYKPPKYSIPVQHRSYLSEPSMMTVKGALLLSLDKPFFGERVARRGYCFTRDEHKHPKRKYAGGRVVRSSMTGELFIKDATKFVLKIGDRIQGDYEKKITGGWRGLYLDELTEEGWEIEEILFYTDSAKACVDGLWPETAKHGLKRIGRIVFNLSPLDALYFETEKDIKGREFKFVEYEVGIRMVGSTMKYYLKIPTSGQFSATSDCFYREGQLDCRAIFQMYQPAGSD